MLHKWKKNKAAVYLVLLMLLCFCLCQYGLQRIFGFSLFPDEFGYWAPAAKMLGWDWSEATSLGSYYSFGYSLVLAPILYFVKDSILAYRTAVVINMILMCIGLLLLYKLMQKLFPGMEKERAVIISGIAVLYPPWIFYMQMTMTEGLLLFLYILICYLFVCFLEKPRALTAVGLSAALVYIYFVHMRSIGMIAAGSVTLLLWAFGNKDSKLRKNVLLALFLLFAFVLVGLGIKDGLIEKLYHGASEELLQYNDYSGQWGKLKVLVSISGIKNFLAGCAGKALYLGLATCGLAYWGIYLLITKVADTFREWKKGSLVKKDYIWCFMLLATAAQFIVTVVYTLGSADTGNSRLDLFIHGRYSELIVPLLLALGIKKVLESRRLWLGTGIAIGSTALFAGIATFIIHANDTGMDNIHGYFMIGMSYLLEEEHFRAIPFLWKAWGAGVCLMLLLALVITVFGKRQAEWILAGMLCLQAALGLQAGEHYVYIGNSYGYGDIQIADKLKEAMEMDDSGRIIHIYEGDNPYIQQVQFRMREIKIEIWDAGKTEIRPEDIRGNDKLILEAGSEYRKIMETQYERSWEAGHLCLYYNS